MICRINRGLDVKARIGRYNEARAGRVVHPTTIVFAVEFGSYRAINNGHAFGTRSAKVVRSNGNYAHTILSTGSSIDGGYWLDITVEVYIMLNWHDTRSWDMLVSPRDDDRFWFSRSPPRPSHRHVTKKSVAKVLMRTFDQISEIKHSHENVWQLIFWCEGLEWTTAGQARHLPCRIPLLCDEKHGFGRKS